MMPHQLCRYAVEGGYERIVEVSIVGRYVGFKFIKQRKGSYTSSSNSEVCPDHIREYLQSLCLGGATAAALDYLTEQEEHLSERLNDMVRYAVRRFAESVGVCA